MGRGKAWYTLIAHGCQFLKIAHACVCEATLIGVILKWGPVMKRHEMSTRVNLVVLKGGGASSTLREIL